MFRQILLMPFAVETEIAPAPQTLQQRIAMQDGTRLVIVRLNEIDWVEADRKFLRLHIGDKVHRVRQTLTELQQMLDPRHFLQVHRSHIVNMESIAALDFSKPSRAFVILRNGKRIAVARSYRKHVRDSLTRSK